MRECRRRFEKSNAAGISRRFREIAREVGGLAATSDGSVRFVKSRVNWQAWYAIATPDGDEAFAADQL